VLADTGGVSVPIKLAKAVLVQQLRLLQESILAERQLVLQYLQQQTREQLRLP
jgi:hypothetical protein